MTHHKAIGRLTALMAALTLGTGALLAQAETVTHEVKAGDTLYGISKLYGITVQELREANPVIADDNIISIGQVLIIPTIEEETTTVQVTSAATQTTTPATTTVRTVTVTTYGADNDTFVEGDFVATVTLGLGPIKDRPTDSKPTFTQRVSVDYCFADDVLGGSSLGIGLAVGMAEGAKYTNHHYVFDSSGAMLSDTKVHHVRYDISALAQLSLHHQWVEHLDTYVVGGLGFGILTDHERTNQGHNTSNASTAAFAASAYAGARYYLTDELALTLQAGMLEGRFNKDWGSGFGLLDLGISYKF